MLRYSFSLMEEADCIEAAVNKVLDKGYRTADLAMGQDIPTLSCTEITEKILEEI
jgi:3-isopropylmalate dehydrogenase